MISVLHIKNIGIIEEISIDLNSGFNVFTGETGAGKSLIIDSLEILSGGRFSKEMIRKGQNYSFVEASIFVEDSKSGEKNIVVSREIYSNGKNSCKINGRLVTVSQLREFMNSIIDIHGQHDNQSLFDISEHIKALDEFAKNDIFKQKREYKEQFTKYLEIKNKLKENYGDDTLRQRKLDLLKYQLNEIENAALIINEDIELNEKLLKIQNAEKLFENLNTTSYEINEIILNSYAKCIKSFEKLSEFDNNYSEKLNYLQSSYYEMQELSRDVNIYKDSCVFDNEELKTVDERLDTINSLKRKYGSSIEEILKYKFTLEEDINILENLEESNNKLKEELLVLKVKMNKTALALSDIRKKYATYLENSINEELAQLDMKNSLFKVNIEFLQEGNFNVNGLNQVEFLIKTNIGDEYKPLRKIASGGEISRIMLAIKTVMADVDRVPIIIFDEIDTGISGAAASRVAKKIKKISTNHQVITITHLPIKTASADFNYKVKKCINNLETKTVVKLLEEKEVLEEIALISTGKVTSAGIKHAMELKKVS